MANATTSPTIRVGLIGAGMMGLAHSLGWSNVSSLYWPRHRRVVKQRLAEASPELALDGAARLDWLEHTDDWRKITRADDIDVVDVVVPNALHHEIVLDAVRHGKHVFCEKPLSTLTEEATEMLHEADAAGVIHQTGFVYRSFPGVALAERMVRGGDIGEVRYFRGQWLSDWAADPTVPHAWRFVRALAGGGVLADTGSHIIDMARFVVGAEVTRVLARSRTFIESRPFADDPATLGTVDTDDVTDLMLDFDGGAIGTATLARTYPGHNTDMGFEIVGSRGSISFSWQRPTDLQYFSMDDEEEVRGDRRILIGKMHPNSEQFWGRGIAIGYTDAFLIQFHLMLEAIDGGEDHGRATFRDGVCAAGVIEAAGQSARTEQWVDVRTHGATAATV